MSLASATNRISYTGNGNVDTYAYTFRIFANTDLLVTVRDTDDEETTLTLSTHYTVTGVGAESGGNVVLVNGSFDWLDADGDLKTGYILSIRRVRPLTQTTDIRNQGDFFPEIHEDAFDHFIMVDQQQQDELDRSIRLPETIDPDDFSNALPAGIADAAGMALIVNADGDGFDLGALETVGIETVPFNNVEYKVFADSPITLTSGANGIVYTVDTSGGAVSITLPSISALNLSLPFSITVLKSTSDTNAVTINRASTDTFNPGAGTSKTISKQGRGYVLIPDADASPDQWTCLPVSDPAIVGDYEADVIHTTNQASDPSTPSSGKHKVYSKTAGIFYIDSSGNVRQLANLAEAQVFTNKDYDGGTASNTSRITVPKNTLANLSGLTRKEGTIVYATDTDKLYKDDGTSLTEIGSGSGGAINYIGNPDAESGTTGWSTYDDGAAAPVDGTGGTVTTTLTATSSSPLRGTQSFLITTTAANLLGEGIAYDFTINSADLAKVLSISFDYSIASGTYATGDFTVYVIQDPSGTPVVIQPAPYQIQNLAVGLPGKFQATFQTSSTVTTYRLVIHRAVSTSSASTIKIDNVIVGPQSILYGAPIGDWTAYTPSSTQGFGTISSGLFYYRRVGDSAHIIGRFTAGTVTASEARVSLPPGMTIDSSKIDTDSSIVGPAGRSVAGSEALFTLGLPNLTYLNFGRQDGSFGSLTAQTGSGLVSTGNDFSFSAVVPIVGWSSTVLMSNDTDTRVVAALADTDTARSISNASATTGQFLCELESIDTHGAYSTSTGIFTCPVPGIYEVSASVRMASNANWNRNELLALQLFKNAAIARVLGSIYAQVDNTLSITAQGTGMISCVAGDTLEVRVYQDTGSSANTEASNSEYNWVSFKRLSGPSAIAATETVACTYETNAAQSIEVGAEIVVYEDVRFDTHSMYNTSTGTLTFPVSGKYNIHASILFADGAWTAGNTARLRVKKNGNTIHQFFKEIEDTETMNLGLQVSYLMSVVAGDTMDITVEHDRSGGTLALSNSGEFNALCVYRIGN